ncbi:TetR/AcrR family transcriptional regulator [Nocardia stercoris]|uniref:TetR/AcrR family transcriptional regulator n=1 Tax=Nocardia stercoris TaxID=2483361 RepID=A0A3M2L442_9NOCA|nr:TetR/AcrR family transcriptional regulator [Nocardia stercoris]RMI31273.1 TetR/AcrR family transcriptional regulator [Nocardia stercoris]
MSAGLRDRKKRETRQAISDTATRLFIQRGFDRVTIAEIAAAAGVSKMTVTNYFPRKEDLVLDTHEEFTAALAGAVATRPPGESALAALRRFYFEALAQRSYSLGIARPGFARLLLGSPVLLGRVRELQQEQEDRLAEVLIAEGGDAFAARAAAAWIVGTYRLLFGEALLRSRDGIGADELAGHLGRAATEVFDRLDASLGDFARR